MKLQKLFTIPFLLFITGMNVQAQHPIATLAKYAGDWRAKYIMWMDTTAESMSFDISVHNEMKMNNLFFTSEYTGNVMDMGYEGISTIGYDSQKGKFESTWMDNMNSGIMYMEGKESADKKIIEFHGIACDKTTSGAPMRQVVTLTDADHFKIEIFMTMNGKERKTLEVTLTKK